MCLCVGPCICMYTAMQVHEEAKEGVEYSGAGVTEGCELYKMGAGNRTRLVQPQTRLVQPQPLS